VRFAEDNELGYWGGPLRAPSVDQGDREMRGDQHPLKIVLEVCASPAAHAAQAW